jgi:hypothetical protein
LQAARDVKHHGVGVGERATQVAFKKLATLNAERIELFTNSRETDTRKSDNAFYAAECLRQVGCRSLRCVEGNNVWTENRII